MSITALFSVSLFSSCKHFAFWVCAGEVDCALNESFDDV